MNLMGKYKVEINNENGEKRFFETKNQIVDFGLRQVLDWLSFDLYNHESFQGLKKIPRNKLFFPNNEKDTATSMYYYESALDYEDPKESDYYYDPEDNKDLGDDYYFKNNKSNNNTFATIDNYRTGKQSITIGFEDGAVMLAAINLDAEMFSKPSSKNNESISFEIEYREINDVTWKKIPCNYTLINDGVRRNVTFFVCENVPPFVYIPCTALKFTFNVNKNTLSNENNLIGKIYNISLFKAHTMPQPPMVMKFGTGSTPVDSKENNLGNTVYSQIVSRTNVDLTNFTVNYLVDIPKEKCNDLDISEIGMFYRYDYVNPTQQHIHQNVKNVNTMFSRALFAEPWKKNENESVTISYEITVSNDIEKNSNTQDSLF